jgi:hypothetical protein
VLLSRLACATIIVSNLILATQKCLEVDTAFKDAKKYASAVPYFRTVRPGSQLQYSVYLLFQLQAYDPDIQDRTAEQHIKYFVVKEDQQMLLQISKNGCLWQIKVSAV